MGGRDFSSRTGSSNSIIDTLVVIPAAGDVSNAIMPFSRRKSPAMISLGGKTVIQRTLDYLIQQGYGKFVIVVKKEDSFVKKFIGAIFGNKVELTFTTPDINRGVGYAILHSILNQDASKLLVVLGDTYFRFPDKKLRWIDFSYIMTYPLNSEDICRWCIVETNKEGFALKFVDKPNLYEGNGQIVAGIYAFDNFDIAKKSFIEAWQNAKNKNVDFEISMALEKYIDKKLLKCVKLKEWYDCGNIDLLIKSRRKIIKERVFNYMIIDTDKSVITKKSSDNKKKLINEIQYYLLLPKELSIFFPRVMEYNVYSEVPTLSMEYYGYPTLSEMFIYEELHPKLWENIFERLLSTVETFKKYKAKADSLNTERNFASMYIKRIEGRLKTIKESDWQVRQIIDSESIVINGKEYLNFPILWDKIKSKIKTLFRNTDYTIIHGDLCFSNILYDISSDVCKLVDPRGSFGDSGVFGDIKYDVAKLYHSVHGEYDFVINDLFGLQKEKTGEFVFEIYNYNKYVLNIFKKVFFEKGGFNELEILLIEGLLFISMPQFHYDFPERQIAMYLRGIEILNQFIKEFFCSKNEEK